MNKMDAFLFQGFRVHTRIPSRRLEFQASLGGYVLYSIGTMSRFFVQLFILLFLVAKL